VNFTEDLFKGDLFFEEVLQRMQMNQPRKISKRKKMKRGM
jgi:hypothetical protein